MNHFLDPRLRHVLQNTPNVTHLDAIDEGKHHTANRQHVEGHVDEKGNNGCQSCPVVNLDKVGECTLDSILIVHK